MFEQQDPRLQKPQHFLLLVWLALTGLVVFGAAVCIDQGLVQAMVVADRSRICIVLIVMYGIGLAHTFVRTLYLSRELAQAADLSRMLQAAGPAALQLDVLGLRTAGGTAVPRGFIADYLVDAQAPAAGMAGNAATQSDLLDAYASRVRGAHEFGWYYIDVMLKVGFLGTLVGFILMLGSVADTGALDANTMQKVLKQMSVGMSTALYTTLASLVGGILLSVPYYLLDRGLDALLQTAIYVREVVLPTRLGPAQ